MIDFDTVKAEQEIESLKKQAQEANRILTESKTKKSMMEENLSGYYDELKKMGIEPENLEAEIEKLVTEYTNTLENAKSKIPAEIMAKLKRT